MPLDVSKFEVSLEEGKRWRRTLHITVPWRLVETERKAEARKLAKKLDLPGFRRGKVPAAVALKRFPNLVDEKAVDRIIDEAVQGALEEEYLDPITRGTIGTVQYTAGSDLSFDISFEVAPRIELTRIGGFRVRRPAAAPVQEGQMAGVLDEIRTSKGTWVPEKTGRPDDGQQVSVRVQDRGAGDEEATPYELILGRGEALEDVESAIRRLEVGETGDFTVRFPEDDEREETQVTISLDGRKSLELRELDDGFAASVSDFETLEALKDDIREKLRHKAEQRAEAAVHRELAEQIIAANSFEVPDSMVEHALGRLLAQQVELTQEEAALARVKLRPQVIRRLKHQLVIDWVAESEQIGPSSEEIDAEVEAIASVADISIRAMYRRLNDNGQLDQLERALTEKKVFEYLKTRSEITASA